jgi:maltoporin
MTDRELLEKAAKAAGLEFEGHTRTGQGVYIVGHGQAWSPLTNDGDALRLAVKLRLVVDMSLSPEIHIQYNPIADMASHPLCEEDTDDEYAATRRAIVRAAAAIGEAA